MAMSTLRRWTLNAIGSRQPWLPRDFSKRHSNLISASEPIEEETIPGYVAERYYPTRIGETLRSRYQIVGKLGYGVTSTVWLARDLTGCRHVALKIFVRSSTLGQCNELAAYRRMENGPVFHPGRQLVRSLLDSFTITGPDGEHQCLVHPPLWGSLQDLMDARGTECLTKEIVSTSIARLVHALDFVHKCKIIHT
ncbi:hypothetical protein H0H93_010730, partial [Arthromyces matolae]